MFQQSISQWNKEGVKRFGPDRRDWKFVCPNCGGIQSVRDMLQLGIEPHLAMKHCISRYNNFKKKCHWTVEQPLGAADKGRWIIVTPHESYEIFDFAPGESEENDETGTHPEV